MWQHAFTGLGTTDMEYLDQDEDRVIIPYLHQLKKWKIQHCEKDQMGQWLCSHEGVCLGPKVQ